MNLAARVDANQRARHLAAVAAAALVCAAVVLAAPATILRAAFAVPLCLFLPGYALTDAVFAKRHLEHQQQLMLALALSLVTLVLGAIVLDLTPGGLGKGSWMILLLVVTLGGCVVGARRAPRRPPRHRRLSARVTRVDVALLIAAAIAAGSAFALSRVPLSAPNAVGYSDLWMLPAGNALAPSVDVGVISDEQHPTTYSLLLRVGTTDRTVDSTFVLKPGQHRRFAVPLPISTPRSTGMVTATLYKVGSPGVYREVTASLPPAPPAVR